MSGQDIMDFSAAFFLPFYIPLLTRKLDPPFVQQVAESRLCGCGDVMIRVGSIIRSLWKD